MQKILQRITNTSLYLLVFLLPLFWLPFSFEAFEFNKQYLLFFLVSVAFFSWLAKMILVDGALKFRKTPLDIFVGVFLLVAVLSVVFSADKSSSIFGFYGRFSDGLIGLLSLGALYFLITNNIVSSAKALKVFLWSAGLAVLMTYLSVLGIWQKLSFLPQVMRQKVFNPVAGSLEGLAVFLTVVAVFLTVQNLFEEKKKIFSFAGFLLALITGLLLIIDFSVAWLVLLLSLVVFVGFTLWKRVFKDSANKLLIPLILITMAVFGLSVNLSFIDGLAKEQVLDRGISWQVSLGAATDDVKSVLLGSGLGTFHYDFAKQKPAGFNQTRFWQIRFDRPGSHLAEVLGTTGFLGLLSWLALIGAFLLISWFLTMSDITRLPILMAFVALVVGQLVYYQNTVLAFTFWFFLGLGAVSWQKPISEKVFSLKKFPELRLISNSILIIVGLGLLAAFYFGARFYLADIAFVKAQYEKATGLNPNLAQYWTFLARSYLQQVQQDQGANQDLIAKAIDAGKQAVLKGEGEVAAFETLAMIYRDIRLLASGAKDWSIKYFEKAIELEPTNPVLRTELAKILAEDSPEKAKIELTRAKELKPDYLPAILQEVLLEEKEGNLTEAVRAMEKLAELFPLNIEVLFQLGRIYFNANRVDEAIFQLEKVLILFPNHSNALYSLGLAWQKKEDKERARTYFEKVLELNPDSAEVKKKLEELK